MLRNVLEDYLSSVKERDFYYPLSALLQAMGFFDIHITDGGSEFGKDFIAKRIEDGVKYQYVIQAKKGDINQPEFRNKILGQLLEAVFFKELSHSQLDTSLPQKAVLVTTGELKDNAFVELRNFNTRLAEKFEAEKVDFWGKNQLIEYAEKYGLIGVHQTTAHGLRGYGQFYQTYSKAIDKLLSDREIEEYSRFWLDENLDYKKRILRAAIEAEIIASKLIEGGRVYEAIITNLSLARVVMETTYDNDDPFILVILKELVEEIILPLCKEFFCGFKSDWEEAQKSLAAICLLDGFFPFMNYLVWCARVLETAALYYFLCDKSEKAKVITFITEFIGKEEGCAHIPGDRYASTLIWPTLALIQAGKIDAAKTLVRKGTVWLCDKVENGLGIAHWDADEKEETAILLFYLFEFMRLEPHRSYYLATILIDLAAFIGDKEFFSDVTNDLDACEIAYFYWQYPDTKAIFTIDTEECRKFSGMVHYADEIKEDYAEYVPEEPDSFQITQKAGLNSLVMLSTLLKDRYFFKMWRLIAGKD
jgi:hypothetical protein